MSGTFGGFDALADEIRRLTFARGKIENIVNTALLELAEDVLATVKDPTVWPVYATAGKQPPSLRPKKDKVVPRSRTTPVRLGLPHSINRWSMIKLPSGYGVRQPATYATFIHDNVEGAPNLIDSQITPIFAAIAEEGIGIVTGSVTRLLFPDDVS